MQQILAVFDFDHTIVHENSDVVLCNLLPKEILSSKKLKALRPSWTAYMAEVFRLLPKHGINREEILNTCRNLAPTKGMITLFHYLRTIECKLVILSDANSEIIETWLSYNLPSFEIEVFTNPAHWSDDVLKVKPYQKQISCKQCNINLCKGSVLAKYRESNQYDVVAYIGDGRNDYCPSQRLQTSDLVFPRKSYALENLLKNKTIEASVHAWESGVEIQNVIETLVKQEKKT